MSMFYGFRAYHRFLDIVGFRYNLIKIRMAILFSLEKSPTPQAASL